MPKSGATYSYTVTSDGGAAEVTGNGTIALGNRAGHRNHALLPDGTLTFSVTLDRHDRQHRQARQRRPQHSTRPAAGYSVTADDSQIGASEAAATGFTFAAAEIEAQPPLTVTAS